LHVLSFATLELKDGIIENGILKNPRELTTALIALKKMGKPKKIGSNYVVVGLPEELVYLTVKPFPSIEEDDIRDALELNLREFMPGDSEKIFWGFQSIKTKENAEVLLASVNHEALTAYLSVFANAKLTPVAVEPSSLASARAFKEISPSLLVDIDKKNVLVAAFSDKIVRYSNGFPFDGENLALTIKKIIGFYKSKRELESVDIIISGRVSADEISKLNKYTGENVLAAKEKLIFKNGEVSSPVVLGLAMRGLLEQKDDENLSLLPLGTAEGYEEKKALYSVGAIANLTTVVSILFIAIFIGFIVLLNYLSYSSDQQLSTLSSQKIDPQTTEAQKKLAALEPKVSYIKTISKGVSPIGDKIQGVTSAAPDGINLKSVTMAKDTSTIQAVGTAQDRDTLGVFKDGLIENKLFSKVDLISTSVTDTSVDFTINIAIKK